MNKEELKGLLPHREPMLLLDEAEVVDGEAHGRITITGDEFFVQGHFPGNPIVPGVIQCEMLAQNCCVLLADDLAAKGATPMYTSLDKDRAHVPHHQESRPLPLCHGRGARERRALLPGGDVLRAHARRQGLGRRPGKRQDAGRRRCSTRSSLRTAGRSRSA